MFNVVIQVFENVNELFLSVMYSLVILHRLHRTRKIREPLGCLVSDEKHRLMLTADWNNTLTLIILLLTTLNRLFFHLHIFVCFSHNLSL